jgi:hypothetical protein
VQWLACTPIDAIAIAIAIREVAGSFQIERMCRLPLRKGFARCVLRRGVIAPRSRVAGLVASCSSFSETSARAATCLEDQGKCALVACPGDGRQKPPLLVNMTPRSEAPLLTIVEGGGRDFSAV